MEDLVALEAGDHRGKVDEGSSAHQRRISNWAKGAAEAKQSTFTAEGWCILPAMRNQIFLSSIATLALASCSYELSEEDSRTAFFATQTVLAAGAAEAQGSAVATPVQADGTPAFRAGGEANVDFTFNCPGGGTARYTGTAVAAGDTSGAQGTFTLSTAFAGCKTLQNITIDGDMDYAASASASDASAQLSFTMNGSLSFSGEVDGTCDIDVKIAASATPGSASGSFEGSVCGHDAKATLSVTG